MYDAALSDPIEQNRFAIRCEMDALAAKTEGQSELSIAVYYESQRSNLIGERSDPL